MNLAQIKRTINHIDKTGAPLPLELKYQKAEDGTQTQWLRHWNNLDRAAIVLHEDLLNKIKADPTMSTLQVKTERRISKPTVEDGITTEGSEYLSYIIIDADPVDASI